MFQSPQTLPACLEEREDTVILRPLPQCVSCRQPISANWMLCTKPLKQPVHWTRERNASTWCGWYFGTGRIRSTVRRSSAMYLTGRQDAGMENLSGWWLQISASWNDGPKKPKRCAILIPWNGKTDSLPGFFLYPRPEKKDRPQKCVSSMGRPYLIPPCHRSGCASACASWPCKPDHLPSAMPGAFSCPEFPQEGDPGSMP